MKKFFILCLMAFVMCSCVNYTRHIATPKPLTPLEELFIKHIDNTPNITTNDLVQEDAFKSFNSALKDTLNKCDIIGGIPMRIKKITSLSDKNDKAYILTLEADDYNFKFKNRFHIECDVIGGFKNDSIAYTLNQDKKYIIKKYQYVDCIQNKKFGIRTYLTHTPFTINLGEFWVVIDELEEYKQHI